MKIKTSELQGVALDWAVAKCECLPATIRDNGLGIKVIVQGHSFSTDWVQGGAIIEREELTVTINNGKTRDAPKWVSYRLKHLFMDEYEHEYQYGPTPLIAAMRCYVASKLGDDVEVPNELCEA